MNYCGLLWYHKTLLLEAFSDLADELLRSTGVSQNFVIRGFFRLG